MTSFDPGRYAQHRLMEPASASRYPGSRQYSSMRRISGAASADRLRAFVRAANWASNSSNTLPAQGMVFCGYIGRTMMRSTHASRNASIAPRMLGWP